MSTSKQFCIEVRESIGKVVDSLLGVMRVHLDLRGQKTPLLTNQAFRRGTYIVLTEPVLEHIPSGPDEIDVAALTSELEDSLFTLAKHR